jgi:hypothetical protein
LLEAARPRLDKLHASVRRNVQRSVIAEASSVEKSGIAAQRLSGALSCRAGELRRTRVGMVRNLPEDLKQIFERAETTGRRTPWTWQSLNGWSMQ